MCVQTLVQKDYVRHKQWAIRLFALAIGSYLFRVMYDLWGTLFTTTPLAVEPEVVRLINGWGFWVLPLVAYEIYLQLRKRGVFARLPAYAGFAVSTTTTAFIGIGTAAYLIAMASRVSG